MKIVNIIGGLGNQMFQYALARNLGKRFGESVYVDTSLFDTYNVHNGLEIEHIFNIKLNQASPQDIKRLTRYTRHYALWRIYRRLLPQKKSVCKESADAAFDESILTLNIDRYYDGYWQNHRYFDDCAAEIRQIYRFALPLDEKNKQIAKEITTEENSVSIHIRRGDYLKHSIYAGICTIEYYQKAVEYIKQHIKGALHFYIFSDDIAWCKDHIGTILGDSSHTYIDWNQGSDSYKDMQLMTLCRHNIIANSSFSWWAAWLNEHRNNIIIAPSKWQQSDYKNHIQMPDWILIDSHE